MAETIKISAEFEDKASKALDSIIGKVEDLEAAATKGFSKSNLAFSSFVGGLAANTVTGAFNTIKDAATELFNVLVIDGVHAAAEAEEALNNLTNAFAASGQEAEKSTKAFEKYATQLEATTKFQDDAIVSAGALIERLTQLDEQGLEKATTAAANLATVLGIDLESAAFKVAKAAEGQTGALQKLGIEIKKGNTDSETFANTLEAINAKFGGAAVAAANTYTGAVTQLKNQFNNLQEAFGGVIVNNQVVIATIKSVAQEFINAKEGVLSVSDSLKVLVAEGIILTINAIQELIAIAQVVGGIFSGAFNLVRAAIDGVLFAASGLALAFVSKVEAMVEAVGLFSQTLANLKNNLSTLFGAIAKEGEETSAKLRNSFGENDVFKKLTESLGAVQFNAQAAFDKMKNGAESVKGPVAGATERTQELSQAQVELGKEGKKTYDELIKKSQDLEERYGTEVVALQEAYNQKLITREQFDEAIAAADSKHDEDEANRLIDQNERLRSISEYNNQQEILDNKAKLDKILASETLTAEQKTKLEAKEADKQKRIRDERFQAVTSSLSALAQFQNAKTKEIAAVSKAAAIAETVISTYTGAAKASEALVGIPIVGPALAVAAAAAYVAAGLARVAIISGVELAGGIDSVPGVGNKDNFPAILAPGERVVPRRTNEDLRSFLAESSGMNELLASIDSKIETISQNVVVNVGGRELVNVIRDELLSGREITV